MKIIANNKSAFYEYQILQKIQVGIKLVGSEVKACRQNLVQLKGSYVAIIKGQLMLLNCNISNIDTSAGYFSHNVTRNRILLVHKKQIIKLNEKVKQKGLTLIPLNMYFENNLIKLDVGIGRGKHNWDKRETIKKRDLNYK